MSEYLTFHCTVQGYSHIKRGTQCQDFSDSFDGDGIHITVVSDGHGQKSSFRSAEGSRMAVDAAMEQLRSLGEFLRGREECLFRQEEGQSLLEKLAERVIRGWHSRVYRHWQENPLTEEELSAVPELADAFRQGRNIAHIYGATLIAAMVTDRYLLVMHQGDGRCVVIHEDGRADQPVPWDERCIGNVCTSLCHSDAARSMRFHVQDLREDKITACCLATDGVEDCFGDPGGLNAFFCEMISLFAREGMAIVPRLESCLPGMSEQGSADDLSVAVAVNPHRAEILADRLMLVGQFHTLRQELHSAREKLNSMERKLEHLKKAFLSALADYESTGCRGEERIRGEQRVQDARREYDRYAERFCQYRNQARAARSKALQIMQVMKLLECEHLLELEQWELEYIRQKICPKPILSRKKPGPTGR